MDPFRRLTESLARRTTRRNLFGKGAGVAAGALLGAAAGTIVRPGDAIAGPGTFCAFPFGTPCPCDGCQVSGVCQKPCVVSTGFGYQTGCWVTAGTMCCDCDCQGFGGITHCGCGSDYHNHPANCPP